MRTYLDFDGNTFSHAEVIARLMRYTGCTAEALDYLRIGEIYRNGGIYFQRMT